MDEIQHTLVRCPLRGQSNGNVGAKLERACRTCTGPVRPRPGQILIPGQISCPGPITNDLGRRLLGQMARGPLFTICAPHLLFSIFLKTIHFY